MMFINCNCSIPCHFCGEDSPIFLYSITYSPPQKKKKKLHSVLQRNQCIPVSSCKLFTVLYVSVWCVRVQDGHASQAGCSPWNPQWQPSLHLWCVRKGLQAAEPDEKPPDHPCRTSAIRPRDVVLQQDLWNVQANVCKQQVPEEACGGGAWQQQALQVSVLQSHHSMEGHADPPWKGAHWGETI